MHNIFQVKHSHHLRDDKVLLTQKDLMVFLQNLEPLWYLKSVGSPTMTKKKIASQPGKQLN